MRKMGKRVISEYLYMPATQLPGDKYLSLLDDNHLQCVTSEHTRGQLGRKEKATFSIKYLFVHPFWGKSIFPQVGNLPVFNAAWKFGIKSVQNLVLS